MAASAIESTPSSAASERAGAVARASAAPARPAATAEVEAGPEVSPTPAAIEAEGEVPLADLEAAAGIPAAPSDEPESEALPTLDQALALHEADPGQESLGVLAAAACRAQEPSQAHLAFRKLLGKDVRARVLVHCRKHGIDVTNPASYARTAEELLEQAKAALKSGDPARALELARASNRQHRTPSAVLTMGLAACAAADTAEAAEMKRHIALRHRGRFVAACKEHGIAIAYE